MTTHLGPGDAATWGTVWHPNDPRQEEKRHANQDQLDALSCMVEEARYQLNEIEIAINRAKLSQAQMLTLGLVKTAITGIGA